jgi:predicted molibdopterin-dependent oxidoreductase YjgC
MPIRGHSGVQGGAEMGAYATALPGGLPLTPENIAALEAEYGFALPREPGLAAPDMLDAAHRGELSVLFAAGGNFLDVLPDPAFVREALERAPLRAHMDLFLTSQMLVDGEDVLLLPAATRYEIPGGVTETSTERRVIFSPEVPGPRVAGARPEHDVFMDLARRVRPDLASSLRFSGTPAIREEIERVVPAYAGIARLRERGDQFQYGGPHLCAGGEFPRPGGRARFANVAAGALERPSDAFLVSTRRGKQFNSMVHEDRDAVTGAARDAVLIHPEDAARLGVSGGDALVLRSEHGEYRGRAHLAPVKPGNLQVHWPEGNALLGARRRSRESRVPDYNALVRVERAP